MIWQPKTYAEGLRMAWDEDDDGIDHCLSYIEPHLPETGTVLDIGAGVGRLAYPIALRYPSLKVIAFDPSIHMVTHGPEAPNLTYRTTWPFGFDFAFSVLTFQHLSDDKMIRYVEAVARRTPFVFQFVAGTERQPLSMQRSTDEVIRWCVDAGFAKVNVQQDSRFENWRWVHAR